MSREHEPRRVDVDETSTRQAAGRTAAAAYLLAPSAWLFAAVATIMQLGLLRLTSPGGPWLLWTVPAHVFLPLNVVMFAVIVGIDVYRSPGRSGRRLFYLRTEAAAAAVVLRPDHRRGALPGDIQGIALVPGRTDATRAVSWARGLVNSSTPREADSPPPPHRGLPAPTAGTAWSTTAAPPAS